ncbi:MAG: hypothetical protein QW620_08300 [Thermoplasmata archaeon]
MDKRRNTTKIQPKTTGTRICGVLSITKEPAPTQTEILKLSKRD